MNENDLVFEIEMLANYLDQIANEQDEMARQSKSGGWSTHQVAKNMTIANECRRRASQARNTVDKYREE